MSYSNRFSAAYAVSLLTIGLTLPLRGHRLGVRQEHLSDASYNTALKMMRQLGGKERQGVGRLQHLLQVLGAGVHHP